jgi:hypothetical protein
MNMRVTCRIIIEREELLVSSPSNLLLEVDLAPEGTCVPDVRFSRCCEAVGITHRTDDRALGSYGNQQGARSEILAHRQRLSGGAPECKA